MEPIDIKNPQVIKAISAIHDGCTIELLELINQYPWLVETRLHNNEEGYFKDPYLLWFIADNPILAGRLPNNIIAVTEELLQAIKQYAASTYQYQINYALGLVVSDYTPRQCGVQIPMLELLVNAGALPDKAMDALTNGNVEAAKRLIELGSPINLALAVCLERESDIERLAQRATADEKTTALAAAAYYGKVAKVKQLLTMNIDPNGFPMRGSGFHSHGTPLHQAVSSGSLVCVKLLVEAGAKLDVPDRFYHGTPLGWATYLQSSTDDEMQKGEFALIKDYLDSLN